MADSLDELKKLPAAERIKKLKEIAKRDEDEIKAAQAMLKASEEQMIEEEASKKKIPVSGMADVDIDSLFGKGSIEAKLFKKKKEPAPEEGEAPSITKKEVELEETVKTEDAKITAQKAEEMNQYQTDLAKELTGGSANQIYSITKTLYDKSAETGYLNMREQAALSAANEARQQKLNSMQSGDYLASKEASAALVGSYNMAKAMQDRYKGG